MSQPPPGRIPVPLPFKAYALLMLWTTIAVAGVFTVVREVAYVQVTNSAFWTYAPAVLSLIALIQVVGEIQTIRRLRHPAGQP